VKMEIFQKFLSGLNIGKQKRVAYILILGIWVLIQFSFGNKFYALCTLVLILATALYRPAYYKILAALVLVIGLFTTPTIITWTNLIQSNLSTVQHLELTLTTIFTPDSGREVLPVQVQQMLVLLQTYQINSFQLSSQLAAYRITG